jgi:hypothetical protein
MHAVVAMYESHGGAAIAFNVLQEAELDMHQLTIVGENSLVGEQRLGFEAVGIPARRVVDYEEDVKSGKFLVLAGGTADVIGRACALLGKTCPTWLAAHAA